MTNLNHLTKSVFAFALDETPRRRNDRIQLIQYVTLQIILIQNVACLRKSVCMLDVLRLVYLQEAVCV